jgi:hypothetical protein
MNDGGPAFPTSSGGVEGMSLRDWYAGMAMKGLLASSGTAGLASEFAKTSFMQADEMIKARSDTSERYTGWTPGQKVR